MFPFSGHSEFMNPLFINQKRPLRNAEKALFVYLDVYCASCWLAKSLYCNPFLPPYIICIFEQLPFDHPCFFLTNFFSIVQGELEAETGLPAVQEHLALLGGQAKGLLLGMLLVPEERICSKSGESEFCFSSFGVLFFCAVFFLNVFLDL